MLGCLFLYSGVNVLAPRRGRQGIKEAVNVGSIEQRKKIEAARAEAHELRSLPRIVNTSVVALDAANLANFWLLAFL